MNLNQVTLPSVDVGKCVAFYKALGFALVVSNLPRYARFECPEGGTTFSLEHAAAPPQDTGVVIYFECADVDARYSDLLSKGFTFDSPPADQPWLWREAYLKDPSGNVLCLYHAGSNRRYPPDRVKS